MCAYIYRRINTTIRAFDFKALTDTVVFEQKPERGEWTHAIKHKGFVS